MEGKTLLQKAVIIIHITFVAVMFGLGIGINGK
jgi:hypothetical protein